MWVTRIQHTLWDRSEHERLRAEARCAPAWAAVRRIELTLPQLQETVRATYDAHHATLGDLSTAELHRRGPAETLDPDSVIVARRVREHRRNVVAPAQAAYAEAQALLNSSRAELTQGRSLISVVADATQMRVVRLAEHHERRVAVYRRAYVRAWAKRHRVPALPRDELTNAGSVLGLPSWVDEKPPREVFSEV